MIKITFDKVKLKRIEKVLGDVPRALPRLMSRSINRTLTSARTFVARQIARSVKRLKVGDARKRLFIERATYRRWSGRLTPGTLPFTMGRFAYGQTRKGVPYRIFGGRITMRRAFYIPGAKPVFVRALTSGKTRRRLDWLSGQIEGEGSELVGRLPIARILGPSLAQLYTQGPQIETLSNRFCRDNLSKNIDERVNLELKKLPR